MTEKNLLTIYWAKFFDINFERANGENFPSFSQRPSFTFSQLVTGLDYETKFSHTIGFYLKLFTFTKILVMTSYPILKMALLYSIFFYCF